MKKALTYLSIIALVSFQLPVQQKEYTLKLTEQELNIVYDAIDNSTQPGQIRKPLLQKIATQFQAQQTIDTTHKKK